jgi:hypothetical protein
MIQRLTVGHAARTTGHPDDCLEASHSCRRRYHCVGRDAVLLDDGFRAELPLQTRQDRVALPTGRPAGFHGAAARRKTRGEHETAVRGGKPARCIRQYRNRRGRQGRT